jgi:hypothetical protein
MTYKMDCISDVALDLGVFALDSELESGLEFSERIQTGLPWRDHRAVEIHREAVRAAGSPAKTDQQAGELLRR